MPRAKKSNPSSDLVQALKKLGALPPRDRMAVYVRARETLPNAPAVFDARFDIEKFKIPNAGAIELRKPRVFLSHSSVDKPFVSRVARRLARNEIGCWVDEGEIRFGDSLITRLSSALLDADLVLAFLSEASVQSEWVKRELEIAITSEIRGKRTIVLPILLDPVTLPPFLSGKLYADFTTDKNTEKNFPKLVTSIRSHFGGADV
jgi:hypothetical protein